MSSPSVAWLNGRIVPFAEASVPLEDRGLQFGESLYEVVAVTRGRARLLDEHAQRMRRGAEVLGLTAGAPGADEWERIFAALQEREHLEEGFIYAQLTGGTAPRAHLPHGELSPTFFAYLVPFRFPRAEQVDAGVAVITTPDIRWARRDLKTTMLLPAVLAKRDAAKAKAAEALLLGPDQNVHEGAASNVFCVEGTLLVTPRQSERLLPGTTRPLVGEEASSAGLTVSEEAVSLERLLRADEVFLTSTTQLVMPVVAVDGRSIGSGRGGLVAVDLAARIRRRLELD